MLCDHLVHFVASVKSQFDRCGQFVGGMVVVNSESVISKL
jgi:hypothetical protein